MLRSAGGRGIRGDGEPGGKALEALARKDFHVSDFHAGGAVALDDLALEHAATADPGAGEDPEQAAVALARPEAALAVDAGIDVVHQGDRATEGFLELLD